MEEQEKTEGTKTLKTRQFRENPFCWQEKKIFRFLKTKYEKKTLASRRSVYLALTEIDSDFGCNFIKNYTKTVSTYAGISRALTSKILKEFKTIGLIQLTILRDSKGHFTGRIVELLSGEKLLYIGGESPLSVKLTVGKMTHKKVITSLSENKEEDKNIQNSEILCPTSLNSINSESFNNNQNKNSDYSLEEERKKETPLVPQPPPLPFDQDVEIEKLKNSDLRQMQIIGLYLDIKGGLLSTCDTKDKFNFFVRRNVRIASELKVYTNEELEDFMWNMKDWAKKTGYDWTLETVAKRISDIKF